jgi:neutral amino acid transport system ATP-binding protein
MLLGAQKQTGENLFQVLIQPRRVQREEKQQRDRALMLLESVGLADKAYEYAGALSGGQRKLLELARAMMTHPKLILLDEPAAGVNPILINQISDHVLQWNEEGITFLIIEHNMDVIMSLCQEIWVLAEGTNLAHGTPEEIQGNSEVLEAYLGK